MENNNQSSYHFKKGDKVVLLSMVSSTPSKPCLIFEIEGRPGFPLSPEIPIGYYVCAVAKTPEGESIPVMRPNSCFIPAHVIKFSLETPVDLGSDVHLTKDTILTVRVEKSDHYVCFETGNFLLDKSWFEDVEI